MTPVARRSTPPARLRQPAPEPLETDEVRVVAAGTLLWVLALLVLLPFAGRLAAAGRSWWLWTCLLGILLGLAGIVYCRRRRDRPGWQGDSLKPPG